MADSSAGPIREKKSRSRSGCYTCRRRKKACDHVHPVCGNCRRLEIPCIYQKVSTGNKKRKKKGKDGEDEEELDNDEEEVDPEVAKAKEKPFYSLLTDDAVAQTSKQGSTSYGKDGPPDMNQHISFNTGYQLPFAGSAGDSLTTHRGYQPADIPAVNANNYLYHTGQGSAGMNMTSTAPFPLLDQGPTNAGLQTAIISSTPTMIDAFAANSSPSLAMFTQSLGIDPTDTIAHHGNTFMSNMQHLANSSFPSTDSPHGFNEGLQGGQRASTSAAQTLDTLFSPLNSHANADQFSPHGSSPDTIIQGSTARNMDTRTHVSDTEQEGIEEVSSATAVRPFSPNTAQLLQQFMNNMNTPERPMAATTDHLQIGQMTQTLPPWLWAHVPNLVDYFVNGFAPVISVLSKPSRNRLLKTLLPATSSSPILLHALVGWAASHLAVSPHVGGEPYTSIARITTSIADQKASVNINAVGMPSVGQGHGQEEELSLENEMWLLLILGGIEVCCGSIAKWNKRLPYIRNLMWRLEASLPSSNTNSMSSVHMTLACNTIYHDVLGSLATTRDPGIPLRVYESFVRGSLTEPDVYMGASATVYLVYAEIAILAARVSVMDAVDPTVDTQYDLRDLLLHIHSCAGKIDTLDVHPNIVAVTDDCPEDAFDNHHLALAFQMHKLAARLLLRQTCLRCAPVDLESRLLCARLLLAIQPVLNTPSEAQVLLPLFLVGVDAISLEQRGQVRQIFKSTRQRTGCDNAHAVYGLLKRVWALNPEGRVWVDWRALAEQSEAVISFA